MLVKPKGTDDIPTILTSGEVVLPVHALKIAGAEIKEVLKDHGIELAGFAKGGRVRKTKAKARASARAQAAAKATGNIVRINIGADATRPKRRRAAAPRQAPTRVAPAPQFIPFAVGPHPQNDNPFLGRLVEAIRPVLTAAAAGPRPLVASVDSVGARTPVPTIGADQSLQGSETGAGSRLTLIELREMQRAEESERARGAGAPEPEPGPTQARAWTAPPSEASFEEPSMGVLSEGSAPEFRNLRRVASRAPSVRSAATSVAPPSSFSGGRLVEPQAPLVTSPPIVLERLKPQEEEEDDEEKKTPPETVAGSEFGGYEGLPSASELRTLIKQNLEFYGFPKSTKAITNAHIKAFINETNGKPADSVVNVAQFIANKGIPPGAQFTGPKKGKKAPR